MILNLFGSYSPQLAALYIEDLRDIPRPLAAWFLISHILIDFVLSFFEVLKVLLCYKGACNAYH